MEHTDLFRVFRAFRGLMVFRLTEMECRIYCYFLSSNCHSVFAMPIVTLFVTIQLFVAITWERRLRRDLMPSVAT
jgi:hypothetical protein